MHQQHHLEVQRQPRSCAPYFGVPLASGEREAEGQEKNLGLKVRTQLTLHLTCLQALLPTSVLTSTSTTTTTSLAILIINTHYPPAAISFHVTVHF